MVILDVSFPLSSLPILSELAHLLWWIPGPRIAISSVNNLNRNSFNWLEWGIFQLKVRYINLNISFTDKIHWQVSCFPQTRLCALFQLKEKRKPTILIRESSASHKNTQIANPLCLYSVMPSICWIYFSITFNCSLKTYFFAECRGVQLLA